MAFFLEPKRNNHDDVACYRMFIMAYNVNETIMDSLKFPKARSDGEFFNVRFMAAAFDDRAKRGEFYLGFKEKVHCSRVQSAFEEAEARGVTCETFGRAIPALSNDGPANALLRVWETAFNGSITGNCLIDCLIFA